VVGLLGSECSTQQAEQIVGLVRRVGIVYVLSSRHRLGEACAVSVLREVAPYRPCRWIKLDKDQRPGDLPADDLHRLLAGWSER
jgi:hypothetical protein